MLWSTSVYKQWGWGWVGVRVVIYLQCLVALAFLPVVFTAYLMNKKVYHDWWDRQKRSSSGGMEGEAFLSNVLFCFFLLEDVPSVIFNLLVEFGESNAMLSIQGANVVATLFGLAVRVVESEGLRRVRTDEAVALAGGGGWLKVTKENIGGVTATLQGTGSRPFLEKLNLQACEQVYNIASFLVRLKERTFTSLQSLDLPFNEMGDEGVKIVVDALKTETFPSLQNLDLTCNEIGDEKGLAEFLNAGTPPLLQRLVIDENDRISGPL
uniref:Uncharacterized protein n=1 Tax=Chromera velia CCMP2878 TaxID=1169474 RepID=A0A0G4FS96_9ALVE|eukprot:Cvel_18408.t1-p1 / transcript=Cvel_18408.t1 / gene=Cvel_18408 / organism=Chromera_velia_CCMP2878 / gene_product=hypothetical protein / transcript_product=hypothetical protein / location=Cvel_scaffold1522:33184-34086(-) / protein_length=266 / sequence_SO=supercontig / SO=protein_coding / is_pseudo=false